MRPGGRRRRAGGAILAAAAWGLLAGAADDAGGQIPPGQPHRADVLLSALHDFRVVTVAEGLVNPSSMAFTPEGDLLVTERPGRLRIVRDGRLLADPVAGLPEILALGRGARADR